MLPNFALFFIIGIGVCLGRNIPDYIHVCKRTDPEVSKCIIQSIEALKPQLKTGIEPLGVPSIEPLKVNEIQIFRGGDASDFKAHLKNVKIHGVSDLQILQLKADVEKSIYKIVVKFPKLTLEGDYFVDAKLLLVPIKGEGTFSAEVVAPEGYAVLEGRIIKKAGRRQLFFTGLTLKLNIEDYDIHLENLFGGDATLRQAIHEVFVGNKKEIMGSALPFIEEKVAEFLLDSGNKITDGLNYDEVFPE